MTDTTLEALNRMIDAAGRDDLTVVNVRETATLAAVLDVVEREADAARERVPIKSKRDWTGADEITAAEWLAVDRVARAVRALAEQTADAVVTEDRPIPERSDLTVRGRVRVGGDGPWRPAYFSPSGAFVAPTLADPWRHMRVEEERTFQPRIPSQQHTTGRIWDDDYYEIKQARR